LESICKSVVGLYIKFHVLKSIEQFNYMELICLIIVCSGDMKYTCRWIE